MDGFPNGCRIKGRKMQKNNKIQKYKTTRLLLPYTLIAYALILTGCAQTQPQQVLEQICLPDTQKQQAMQIGEDVLGLMHFTVSKADVEQGSIRTKPLPGAQSFEFWRSDNVGSFNSTEANLHSIRRIVELDINPQAGRLCIGCDVKVQRLSMPERDVTTTARVYEIFSPSTPAMQRLKLHSKQREGMAWIELGSDKQLATDILKRIEEHAKIQE
jgi:hypothetical protein